MKGTGFKLFIVAFTLLGLNAQAQDEQLYQSYLDKYPNKEVAVVEMRRKLDFDLKDNKPLITYSTREELIYIGKKPYEIAKRSVGSSKFMTLNKIEAVILTPEKGKYRSSKVDDFKEVSVAGEDIFYDDSKSLNFQLTGLQRGSRTIIDAKYQIMDPHMIPSLPVPPYMPVEKCILEISYPTGMDIGITELNFPADKNYTETVKGKKTTRTYTFNEIKGTDFEGDGPDWRYFTPEVHVRLRDYKDKAGNVPVLRNVDDLHSWYCSFIAQSLEDFSDFKNLSDSIVAGATTSRQKAEKLYIWVQKNIRYIAIEDGYMGYIPQKASLVCHNRYGDCKGMSNLLYYLMKAQGLNACHAWIGTRGLPYSYSEISSPSVTNHMIVCYKENGENLFLDPTHSNLAFGLPSPFIQEKEAMVTNDCLSYEIIKVPLVEAARNEVNDSVWVKLNGTSLEGRGKAVLTGHMRMSFLDRINPQDPKAFLEYCRVYFSKGNNKFMMDTIWVENTNNPNSPLVFYYKFHNPEYVLQLNGESYLNLNLDRESIPEKIKKDRTQPIEYKFTSSMINTVIFEIPANLKVEEIPENFAMNFKGLDYKHSYTKTATQIIKRAQTDRNTLSVKPTEFENWNKFSKASISQSGNQIVLIPVKK